MNTGIGDAVDIGWKLAAVLQGWGGSGLLESYTLERKPIAMINVNEAAEMRASFDHQTPFSPKIEADSEEGRQLREEARAAIMRTRAKEFQHDSAGIELGYRYENSPICIADGTPPPGYESPRMSIEFNRMPADGDAVKVAYAPGSGITVHGSAATHFKYVVSNTVRDGELAAGAWRPDDLPAGDYTLRITARDYVGNVASAGRDLKVALE